MLVEYRKHRSSMLRPRPSNRRPHSRQCPAGNSHIIKLSGTGRLAALVVEPFFERICPLPRTALPPTVASHEHDSERGQRDCRNRNTSLDLLPHVHPAFIKRVVVDEARDTNNCNNDHQNL